MHCMCLQGMGVRYLGKSALWHVGGRGTILEWHPIIITSPSSSCPNPDPSPSLKQMPPSRFNHPFPQHTQPTTAGAP